jgi:hypothetical protein
MMVFPSPPGAEPHGRRWRTIAGGSPDQARQTRTSGRHFRGLVAHHLPLCIATLVAVLLVVPPLVSALDGDGGQACSSVRLHRGFGARIAKIKLTLLSHDVATPSAVVDEAQKRSRVVSRSAALDESTLDSAAARPPETRRGPPTRFTRKN